MHNSLEYMFSDSKMHKQDSKWCNNSKYGCNYDAHILNVMQKNKFDALETHQNFYEDFVDKFDTTMVQVRWKGYFAS